MGFFTTKIKGERVALNTELISMIHPEGTRYVVGTMRSFRSHQSKGALLEYDGSNLAVDEPFSVIVRKVNQASK